MADAKQEVDTKGWNYIPERFDTFGNWMEQQKIPIIKGFFADINKVELEYWDLKGGPGAFVVLDGTGGVNDGYVCEIPPGGKLKPQKHLYEEMVYITKGNGSTTVWQRDGRKHSFEWGTGSLFAIPLNARYQHFNGSGTEPARYFSVTNAVFMMNLFHNQDFIFDNDFAFLDRFNPAKDDYFSGEGEILGRFFMSTNFIPDTIGIKLMDYSERGKGSTNMKFDLAGNTMCAHISEFPVGTYKKGHKHGADFHVFCVHGLGYSLLWYPDDKEFVRVDWKHGVVFAPPDGMFHQHFNTNPTPARYLAIAWGSQRYPFVQSKRKHFDTGVDTSLKAGGNQIEYEDQDPRVHEIYLEELKKNGVTSGMGQFIDESRFKVSAS
jgi:uncharacterized RmlC-like cupin family protein